MSKLTVEGFGDFEVTAELRLVSALIGVVGSDQLHACGGKARCTTCRVKFLSGEPEKMTFAEKEIMKARGISDLGVRLSCQILCEQAMRVELISRLEGSGRKDQGSPVADSIEPQPVVWTTKEP